MRVYFPQKLDMHIHRNRYVTKIYNQIMHKNIFIYTEKKLLKVQQIRTHVAGKWAKFRVDPFDKAYRPFHHAHTRIVWTGTKMQLECTIKFIMNSQKSVIGISQFYEFCKGEYTPRIDREQHTWVRHVLCPVQCATFAYSYSYTNTHRRAHVFELFVCLFAALFHVFFSLSRCFCCFCECNKFLHVLYEIRIN